MYIYVNIVIFYFDVQKTKKEENDRQNKSNITFKC